MSLIPSIQEKAMPKAALALVLAVCALPLLFSATGVSFGALEPESAAFVHTLLEWTGVCVAVFTVLLAFLHFHEKGEASTPVIGLVWFCAALFDSVHVLGANGIVVAAAGREAFTELTWLLSRTLSAVVLVLGASFFLISGPIASREERRRGTGLLLAATVAVGVAAAVLLHACTTREVLPDMMRSWGPVARAWDLLPLTIFALAALLVLPTFYRWQPSVFTHALWVSMVPQIATQCYMAFGTSAPDDANYLAAHGLKLLAYSVPLVGLLMDFRLVHAQSLQAERDRGEEHLVRQQAEEALTFDRGVLKVLMENGFTMVGIKDASLRYTRVNAAHASLLGVARPLDAVGKRDEDFLSSGLSASAQPLDQQVLQTGEPILDQKLELDRDGKRLRLSVSRFPLQRPDGATAGVVTISRSLSG